MNLWVDIELPEEAEKPNDECPDCGDTVHTIDDVQSIETHGCCASCYDIYLNTLDEEATERNN